MESAISWYASTLPLVSVKASTSVIVLGKNQDAEKVLGDIMGSGAMNPGFLADFKLQSFIWFYSSQSRVLAVRAKDDSEAGARGAAKLAATQLTTLKISEAVLLVSKASLSENVLSHFEFGFTESNYENCLLRQKTEQLKEGEDPRNIRVFKNVE
jgi:hypothetical protein